MRPFFSFISALTGLILLSACNDAHSGAAQPQTAEKTATETKPQITLPKILAGANLEMGKREFRKCKACHTLGQGQPNRIGPNLYGVFGRHSASTPKFRYSKALKASALVWNIPELDAWLTNPRANVPGTSMSFVGIRDEKKRKALLGYLYIQSGGQTNAD